MIIIADNEYAIKSGKALRKHFALLFEAGTDSASNLEIIGKGIEDMSIAPNANVETTSDILGNNETILDKYEKSTDVDPIYVEGGNKFSEFLDKVEEEELTGDSVVKEFVWVKLYKPLLEKGETTKESDTVFKAWKQKAVVELTNFGGDTKGVSAPCTLHWVGKRTHGSVTVTDVDGNKSYSFAADPTSST
ncbi:MAG: hypothetical protein IJ279_04165 [Clostridia bacterium]|nr:hypothetical protein [Clostridia bacterium]